MTSVKFNRVLVIVNVIVISCAIAVTQNLFAMIVGGLAIIGSTVIALYWSVEVEILKQKLSANDKQAQDSEP